VHGTLYRVYFHVLDFSLKATGDGSKKF